MNIHLHSSFIALGLAFQNFFQDVYIPSSPLFSTFFGLPLGLPDGTLGGLFEPPGPPGFPLLSLACFMYTPGTPRICGFMYLFFLPTYKQDQDEYKRIKNIVTRNFLAMSCIVVNILKCWNCEIWLKLWNLVHILKFGQIVKGYPWVQGGYLWVPDYLLVG